MTKVRATDLQYLISVRPHFSMAKEMVGAFKSRGYKWKERRDTWILEKSDCVCLDAEQGFVKSFGEQNWDITILPQVAKLDQKCKQCGYSKTEIIYDPVLLGDASQIGWCPKCKEYGLRPEGSAETNEHFEEWEKQAEAATKSFLEILDGPSDERASRSSPVTGDSRKRTCLCCGRPVNGRQRRYCRPACRTRFRAALDVALSLLESLQIPYAAVSFSECTVYLDVLWKGCTKGSRFEMSRLPDEDPAAALYRLVNEVGSIWHQKRDQVGSRYAASEFVLGQGESSAICPESLVPQRNKAVSGEERQAFRCLALCPSEVQQGGEVSVRRAQRSASRRHHPDAGGTHERMKEVNQATEILLKWLVGGRTRIAIERAWCFDASVDKWYPPA